MGARYIDFIQPIGLSVALMLIEFIQENTVGKSVGDGLSLVSKETVELELYVRSIDRKTTCSDRHFPRLTIVCNHMHVCVTRATIRKWYNWF